MPLANRHVGIEVFYPELQPHPALGNPPSKASYPPSTDDIWNAMYWEYRISQHRKERQALGAKYNSYEWAVAAAYTRAVILASLYATSFVDQEECPEGVNNPNLGDKSSQLDSLNGVSTTPRLKHDVFDPNAFFLDLHSSLMSQDQLFRKHISLPQDLDRYDIVRLTKCNAAVLNASLLLYPVQCNSRGRVTQNLFPMKDDGSGRFQAIQGARHTATVIGLALVEYDTFPRALTLGELNHAIWSLRGYGLDKRPPKVMIPGVSRDFASIRSLFS